MKDSTRSIVTAAGLLCAIGAVMFGSTWRERVEHSQVGSPDVSGLVASSSDNTIGVVEFFREMSLLLKREYVDPVNDDEKLASGAVRGMIGSLGDLYSRFLDKDELRVYQGMRDGHYEGIGVELTYKMEGAAPKSAPSGEDGNDDSSETTALSATRFPRLVVTNVVPGGPADKAGVKVGDVVDSVNGHWLIDSGEVAKFQDAQRKVAKGQMPRSEYAKIHRTIRLKVEGSIMPAKARARIIGGTSGDIDVVWVRNGKPIETKIEKSASTLPVFNADGSTVSSLMFVPGASDRLESAISGKQDVIIDLRHNVGGDYEAMRKCLVDLLPAGQYGYVVTGPAEKPKPFVIGKGVTNPPTVKLIVDASTAGAAESFARILTKFGKATLSGTGMRNDPVVFQLNKLPDGTGYTLATGRFSLTPPGKPAAGAIPKPKRVAEIHLLEVNA